MNTRKTSILTILITAFIGSILGSSITFFAINSSNKTLSTAPNNTIVIEDVAKSQNVYHAVTTKAMPSVVGITTVTIDTNNIFAIPQQAQGVGTGFIVDSKGYILTNSHVVSDGEAIEVNVLFNDGTTEKGKVLWSDYQLDLAIVKVNKKDLTACSLGNSDDVRVGDISIAIGNPLGLEFQKSVTQGIISGLDRNIQTEKTLMTGLMQTDASINPGNSGGPLLNSEGEVVAINTAKASKAEGLGFAIPINIAKPIIKQIIQTGAFEKLVLGVKIVDVKMFEAIAEVNLDADEGIYVLEVVSNSPAGKSDIDPGDVIIQVGDIPIKTTSDLNKALYSYKKGDTAKIKLNRSGKLLDVDVTF